MKIIYSESQNTASATSEAAGFPAINVLNNRPKQYWKGNSASETLTIKTTAAGINAIGIFAANATQVVCTIKDNAGGTTYNTQTIAMSYNRAWIEFTRTGEILTLILAFTGPSQIQVGVVKCGLIRTLANPKPGLQDQTVDTSIVFETADKGMIITDRDKYRAFDMALELPVTTQLGYLNGIYQAYGRQPIAIRVSDNHDQHEWCGLWNIKDPPAKVWTTLRFTTVAMGVREVI